MPMIIITRQTIFAAENNTFAPTNNKSVIGWDIYYVIFMSSWVKQKEKERGRREEREKKEREPR